MERRIRRNSMTRTYPIYAISPVEFIDDDDDDDDESIIEIKPIKRQRRSRKHPSRVKPEVSIDPYVIYEYHRSAPVLKSEYKSVTAQTSPVPPVKKKSTIPCGRRCLRIFTLILAVFLLIIAILLLVFSINLLANPKMTKLRSVALVYAQALPSSGFTGRGPTDTLLVTGIIGVIIGIIMFIISICTIVCLVCIHFRYYRFFFFISPVPLIVLFVILLGFAVFIMITGDTELQRLAYSTQATVYFLYNSTSTSLVRDGWDFVQYYFSCCGVKTNNTDWYPAPTTGWAFNSQLPRSCCGFDANDIGHPGRIFVASDVPTLVGFCYYGDIRQPTCYDSIKTNLLITVLVFLIGTALIVLVIAILCIILLFLYRSIHQLSKTPVKK